MRGLPSASDTHVFDLQPLKFIERANAEWLQRELDAEMAAIVEGLGAPDTPLAD